MTPPSQNIDNPRDRRLFVRYQGGPMFRPAGSRSLIRIVFGATESRVEATDDGLFISAALPSLSPSGSVEAWETTQAVQSGMDHDLGYACTDSWMVAGLVAAGSPNKSLAELTESHYRRILRFFEASGYPHLYRTWNYFPSIHAVDESLGLDRYQAFCMGRHNAFAERADFETTLPAASALGSHGRGLLVYAIAGKTPGHQIENPRQVSAFHYPSLYGPKSPSFSRAMIVPGEDHAALFISGTASIRGHESLYIDDIKGQVTETLRNIQSLLTHAHTSYSAPINRIEDLDQLKVYIRQPNDRSHVERLLGDSLARVPPTIILQSDICRAELLVEIEGLYLA
jgi:chorismate lyase / 3-hydroxybenzoate synthase